MAEVDREGLDKQDRRYLELLIGVHNGVNFARESASRTAHVLFSIVGDAGSLLVHANN